MWQHSAGCAVTGPFVHPTLRLLTQDQVWVAAGWKQDVPPLLLTCRVFQLFLTDPEDPHTRHDT